MEKESKILIVEDEAIVALSIKGDLGSAGHQVLDIVSTGFDAIEKIKANCPKYILLDIRLAGSLTGLEVAEFCKEERIPNYIIFMTGYVTPDLKEKALNLNPLAFLEKPLNTKDIINLIKSNYN